MNLRQHISLLLFDTKQAFDRVWPDGLIYKLINLGFPHYLIGLIRSFLSGRCLQVRVGNALSGTRLISAGVPQGSKLSPILFNIYCHDIPTNEKITIAQYADDVALIYSSKTIEHGTGPLNCFLLKVLDWYSQWRFALNESKLEVVFLSRRNRTLPNIVVGSHSVPWSPYAKYLGVYIDRKLKWSKHLSATRSKTIGGIHRPEAFLQQPLHITSVKGTSL